MPKPSSKPEPTRYDRALSVRITPEMYEALSTVAPHKTPSIVLRDILAEWMEKRKADAGTLH